MGVYHILKDGSTPKDITGHVVKMEYAETLYKLMRDVKVTKNKGQKDLKK